jgi:iron only hydrogenase large subunit-like protein
VTEAYYHSLRFDAHRCDRCLACLRACPTHAIRIRGGVAVRLDDRCIDCGECLRVCTRQAVVPLTTALAELARFRHSIAIPSPALYTQVEPWVTPAVVHAALRRCGFDEVVGLSPACAAVTAAIAGYLAEFRGSFPVISSFCPTVVRLVQVRYPSLLDQLVPILSPREVAAREAKRAAADRLGLDAAAVGAVYLTPCPSKMVSIVDHPGLAASHIDAAVAMSDLYPYLMAAVHDVGGRADLEETETASGVSWALSRGLAASLPAEDTMSVSGLANVIRILDDIEAGRLRHYTFVECHACPEGCVSGALTVVNPYVARARAIRLMNVLGEGPAVERWQPLRMETRIVPRPMRPLAETLAHALTALQARDALLATLPRIDCAACGAPTCAAFADDVVRGEADDAACVFVRERRVAALVAELASLCRSPEAACAPAPALARETPTDAAAPRGSRRSPAPAGRADTSETGGDQS